MSRSRLVSTLVLAGLVLSPLPGRAQGTTQTHTVKKGDTLWDLAQQYLGDPFKWPELYRRNTATVQNPNLIYPDQVLVITGDVVATPGTPPDSAGARAVPTMPVTPAEGVSPAAPAPDRDAPPSMTIFNPERFKLVRGERQSLIIGRRPTPVRAGDYARAPFLWDEAGLTGTGSVGSSVSAQSVAQTRFTSPVQILERVYIKVPANSAGAAKERYVSFRYGPTIAGEGRIVIPTGIFELQSAPQSGMAEAVLVTAYEYVTAGQELIPADQAGMTAGSPARVEFGLRTTVLWLSNDPVVPSLGQQVILAAGASDGLVPGDQVTLQLDAGMDANGVPLPPAEVAVLQVTRVTTWGASAILIGQSEGVVKPGMAGRVTAKMP